MNEATRKQIAELVTKNPVVLFMKGSRHFPQCGFSSQVVQILNELAPSYETVNVLSSPELREGIKEYSEWPTIPQLYVNGQFIGGCDIVRGLKDSGELQKLLGGESREPLAPAIQVSVGARRALAEALGDSTGEFLHLKIDAAFEHDLFLGPRAPGEIEVVCESLSVLLDTASASRASGVSIDFVEGASGGFKISNPNEPPKVKQLSAPELKVLLDRGEVFLFDVRPESESALARIEGARPLDAAGQSFLFGLPRDTPIALHCHHGIRSLNAAQELLIEGFRTVYNLKGGIEAWTEQVDPNVPRY